MVRIAVFVVFALGTAIAVSAFAAPEFLNPTGYQPLGCGQNVHSYAIARDCDR